MKKVMIIHPAAAVTMIGCAPTETAPKNTNATKRHTKVAKILVCFMVARLELR